jgi:TPR repeat protein
MITAPAIRTSARAAVVFDFGRAPSGSVCAMADERDADTRAKIDEISKLLGATPRSADALFDAAMRAGLALEFRAADAMIGLDEVDEELVDELRAKALDAFEGAAALGHRDATMEFARRVYAAKDEDRASKAVTHLRAALTDDATGAAHVLLGWMTFTGFGTDAAPADAFRLQQVAAERGNADAMFELYVLLSTGRGTARDEAAGLDWCHKAGDAGSARAMSNLGGFYATGNGVEKNEERAVYWYDKAAHAGNGKAAATLGVMHWLGDGAPEDRSKAKQYFELAEEHDFDWQSLAERCGIDVDEE